MQAIKKCFFTGMCLLSVLPSITYSQAPTTPAAPNPTTTTQPPMTQPPANPATIHQAANENIDAASIYLNPGITAFRGGKWVGSDHLYNLTNKIYVFVEILTPEKLILPVTEGILQSRILELLKKAKIQPPTDKEPGKPSLPLFHFLVMINPIEKGYVAYCGGRLFEEVHLDRVVLDQQTAMQAITWETESLILSPKEELAYQIEKTVDTITNTFVERFQFYENIRTQIQKQ